MPELSIHMSLSNGHANGFNGTKASSHQRPYLKEIPKSRELMVDGEPFHMLTGEFQNSSLTPAKYMGIVWQKLVDTNINTILGCVTREMIEPVEGEFDSTELEQVIHDARSRSLRLVLLWFESFKNGQHTPCRLRIHV